MKPELADPVVVHDLDTIGQWLSSCDAVQLGQPLFIGAPRYAAHPPFMYSMTHKHGENVHSVPGQDATISGASDSFAMGVHTGSHIDALNHCAVGGRLHDGTDLTVPGVQDDARGIRMQHGEAIRPVLAPGVLLDFPAMLGIERLPNDHEITPAELERCTAWAGVEIRAGEVVLLRTGFDTLWDDPPRYLAPQLPGPNGATARLLAERGIVATGSDTMPYEQAPGAAPLEVHAELLFKAGIFIMECLNLVELSRRQAYRFMFAALPLRILGATGSPINPVALIAR
jgi:kynurenine formamidase